MASLRNNRIPRGEDFRKVLDTYRQELRKLNLKKSQVNSFIRIAAYSAAQKWADAFIRQRFNPSYAINALGYQTSSKYVSAKKKAAGHGQVLSPQPWPFVYTGRSMGMALGAEPNIVVVERSGDGYVKVRVPIGAIAFKKADNFFRIPPHELAYFQNAFESYLESILKRGKAGALPRDVNFTAGRKGPQYRERETSHGQRAI